MPLPIQEVWSGIWDQEIKDNLILLSEDDDLNPEMQICLEKIFMQDQEEMADIDTTKTNQKEINKVTF